MMIKIALVGCGYIGGFADDTGKRQQIYSHAKAISKIKECKLVACCDSNKSNLEKFVDRWQVEKSYTNMKEMLVETEVDILVIATPTTEHHKNILEALKYPIKSIFCEKPLSMNTSDSNELIELCEKKGVVLAVNYMRRWDNLYHDCRKLLLSNELGVINSIVAYVDTALYMNSIHMIDLIDFFAGDFETVIGKFDEANEVRIVNNNPDPGAYIMILHKNNIVSFIKASGESKKNHYFELDFQCTKGRLRILDDGAKYEIYKFSPCEEKKWLSKLILDRTIVNSYKYERLVNAYQDIIKSIRSKHIPASDGRSSQKSMRIIEEVYLNKL